MSEVFFISDKKTTIKKKPVFRPEKIGEAAGAIIEILERLCKKERNIVLSILNNSCY